MELKCRIADVRYRKGKVTQIELSEKTGIAVSTLSAYENNKRVPNVITLWKIAKALGCKTDSLYKEVK